MKKIIYILIIVLIAFWGWDFLKQGTEKSLDKPISCEENGGTWLSNFNECEYISQTWCEENDGTFFECESACRNTGAEICTLQCVPVCKFLNITNSETKITNFEECADAGNPVMESYPRQCRDEEGNLFVEEIGNELEKINMIRLDSPRPNGKITSPLVVSGEARGNWFFEASFPLILTDWDGRIIAQSIATAKTDWMTEDFVQFEGTLEFETPENIGDFSKRGSLILKKDNPSGIPEYDDALEIPVRFW